MLTLCFALTTDWTYINNKVHQWNLNVNLSLPLSPHYLRPAYEDSMLPQWRSEKTEGKLVTMSLRIIFLNDGGT